MLGGGATSTSAGLALAVRHAGRSGRTASSGPFCPRSERRRSFRPGRRDEAGYGKRPRATRGSRARASAIGRKLESHGEANQTQTPVAAGSGKGTPYACPARTETSQARPGPQSVARSPQDARQGIAGGLRRRRRRSIEASIQFAASCSLREAVPPSHSIRWSLKATSTSCPRPARVRRLPGGETWAKETVGNKMTVT